MTASYNSSENMLDGLSLEPAIGATSPLRAAVVTTITALQSGGLLEPRHAALAQLALELADSVTAGNRGGRASAAAMAAAQLRETLLALPVPSAGGAQETFDAWVASLADLDAQA